MRAARSIPRTTADTVNGHGLSTNIIEASLEAYLAGLEKLLWLRQQRVDPDAEKETLRLSQAGTPTYSVAKIPGDGIGPEIVEATLTVLDAAGRGVRLRHRVDRGARRRHRHRRLRHGHPRRGPRAPAGQRTRCCWVRSAAPSGTTPRPRFVPSRACSRCARSWASTPTCARSRWSPRSRRPRPCAPTSSRAWT